ncbi:Flp family type IVb pilin [Acidocella sp.]|uniref:Flp family type IVb pilin n=1 Tax=Acidocella sp. TaxID=50710 RepID=UPI003D01B610
MQAIHFYDKFSEKLKCVRGDHRAVTSIEYAVIALIIVAAIVGGISSIGKEVATPFNQVASEL